MSFKSFELLMIWFAGSPLGGRPDGLFNCPPRPCIGFKAVGHPHFDENKYLPGIWSGIVFFEIWILLGIRTGRYILLVIMSFRQ